MNSSKLSLGVALVAVIIAIGSLFYAHKANVSFGAGIGPQHYTEESFLAGLQIGTRSTDIKNVNAGKCSLIGVNANIAASTTSAFDCAVTSALKGDTVLAMFATSSPNGQGWEIVGASASTTPNFITLLITNGTGATAYPPASIASSTQYIDIR